MVNAPDDALDLGPGRARQQGDERAGADSRHQVKPRHRSVGTSTPATQKADAVRAMLSTTGEQKNVERAVAPGYDPYYLEQEWRDWWVDSGCIELQHPDKAFIAFCKKRYERKPNP